MSSDSAISRFCERNRTVLDLLASMEETSFSALSLALDKYTNERGAKTRPGLIAFLGTEIRSLPLPMGSEQDIVDVGLELAIMKRIHRSAASELVESASTEWASASTSDPRQLATRLEGLSSNRSIVSIAGIEDVVRESDHLLMDLRFLSDLRPIYEDVDGEPHLTDLVLLHNLRIRYWSEGEERTFTVVLRDSDLHDLADRVRREELKSGDLRQSRAKALSDLADQSE